jgi:hypothetical protein
VVGRDRPHQRTRHGGNATSLVQNDVGFVPGDHFTSFSLAVGHHGTEIAGGARHDKARGFLARDVARQGFQALHGWAISMGVVADHGVGHGRADVWGGAGDGVRPEVDAEGGGGGGRGVHLGDKGVGRRKGEIGSTLFSKAGVPGTSSSCCFVQNRREG